MKSQNKSFFALFVVSSAFLLTVTVSCKKSNSSGSSSTQMTATVNGSAWASNVPVQALYAQSFGVGAFEVIGGYYKGKDTTAFAIQFNTPFVLHTAISSDTAVLDIGYVNSTTLTEYDGGSTAGHSILTVSSWDSVNHKISGTFSGVLYNVTGGSDSLVVTNGSFSTGYTAQ
jgi:hypothetical protein